MKTEQQETKLTLGEIGEIIAQARQQARVTAEIHTEHGTHTAAAMWETKEMGMADAYREICRAVYHGEYPRIKDDSSLAKRVQEIEKFVLRVAHLPKIGEFETDAYNHEFPRITYFAELNDQLIDSARQLTGVEKPE